MSRCCRAPGRVRAGRNGDGLCSECACADHSRPDVPMDKVIAHELEILGSHGIQAYEYPAVLAMIKSKKLGPEKLIGKTISLEESIEELVNMNKFTGRGVTVINEF